MRRTLFIIPHELMGLPVFGVGWLLLVGLLLFIARLAWAKSRGESIAGRLGSEGIVWAVVAGLVVWVLPAIEVRNAAGEPLGMPIRGYGVMLVLAFAASVALAVIRAGRYGISPEVIYAMAPWTLVGGIAGARIFYVIQYRDRFDRWSEMLMFTEGGLVVYGGILGGFAASLTFLWRNGLPWRIVGDVVVPAIFVGIMFGRIGCLLNGCCYGGSCEPGPMALEFPPGSPVYQEQLYSGELIGLTVDPRSRQILAVRPSSLAEAAGIRPGQSLGLIEAVAMDPDRAPPRRPRDMLPTGARVRVDGQLYVWNPDELPPRAKPVHAAQLYSSGSAAAMACLLLIASRFAMPAGLLLFVGMGGYAVIRFGLELVRVDEAGRFGTSLTISQWVSLAVFAVAMIGAWWSVRHPRANHVAGAGRPRAEGP